MYPDPKVFRHCLKCFRVFFMGKFIRVIFITILFLNIVVPVNAEKTAGHSATMAYNYVKPNTYNTLFLKRLVIKRVLEKYNSVLVENADDFVDTANDYDLDFYLLPSIAGLESQFGRFIWPNSYNPFGWGVGKIMFEDWDHGIDVVGKGLRENYIDKGADSIEDIGYIYANKSETWAGRVTYFINEFKAEEEKMELILNSNTVNL